MAPAPPLRDDERHIVLVVHPGHQILDVAGPHEVFAGANELVRDQPGPAPYRLTVASSAGGTVPSESGLAVADTVALSAIDAATVDTLIVAGGTGVHDACADAGLIEWIRGLAPSCRRVGSVCSGTFVLAGAGLLSGRRVTTHWARAARLAREYPDVLVDPEPIHIRDGHVWTSAGVTAGIDLALALVEDDLGADLAQTVAQWLVMFLRRPGGQAQFAAPVWSGAAHHDGIRDAIDLIHADPGADITVPSLAAEAAMSTRNFTRVFTREVGTPPGRYLEQVRVTAARRLLETSPDTTDVIADRCGFGTAETMRRAFQRCVGTSPGAYRRRFSHTAS